MAAAMRGVMRNAMVVLALLLACVGYANAATCDYSGSCWPIEYLKGALVGQCKNWQGYFLATSLVLSYHIGNQNGSLYFSEYYLSTGFTATCSDVSLSDSTLFALCTNDDGDAVETSLDLDTCITNDNGSLKWCYDLVSSDALNRPETVKATPTSSTM